MRNAILILCISICFACAKSDIYTTSVTGTVINAGNKQPLANYTVYMQDGIQTVDFSGNPLGGDATAIAITDSNGKFSIALTGEYWPYYEVYSEVDTLYGQVTYMNQYGPVRSGLKPLPKNKTITNLVIEYGFYSILNGVIVTDNNLTQADSVTFSYNYPFGNTTLPYFLELYGSNNFTFSDYILGSRYQTYTLQFKRDGVWNTIIDSVYLPPNEEVDLVVRF